MYSRGHTVPAYRFAAWLLGALFAMAGPAAPTTAQSLPAGQPLQLTVADSVFLALRTNRNIESAYLDRVRQKFDLLVAEDTFVPNLDVDLAAEVAGFDGTDNVAASFLAAPTVSVLVPTGAFFSFSWINSTTQVIAPSDSDDVYATDFDLQVTQPLLRGGGIDVNRAPVTLARLNEKVNQLQLKATVINTITSVIQAHRAILLARGQVGIARQSLKRAQELLEVTRALVAAGRLPEIEIVQAESNVASQELSLLSAENSADAARLNLLDQLDIDTRTQIEPIDELNAEQVSLDERALLTVALASRTDYQQAQISIETAKISLLLAQNNRLWDLDLSGGVSVGSTGPTLAELTKGLKFSNPSWRVGLNLNIPIGDLTREQGEIAAQVLLEQTELSNANLRDGIELAVKDGVRNVNSQWLQLEQSRRSLELERKKLDAELTKLNLGLSSNFEVVTFENDLANSETTELSATINYLNTLTQLDQTLGTTLETWQIELTY